jgi:hypothetical protein
MLERLLSLFIALVIALPVLARSNDLGFIKLEKNKFRIVFSEQEPGPLKIALEAFKKDFSNVMGSVPQIV